MNLLINGKVVGYIDNDIVSSSKQTIEKKVSLSDFTNQAIKIGDTVQIGIQTWIRNVNKIYTFDAETSVCSKPEYIGACYPTIDKLYLKIDQLIKRIILYNCVNK